MEFLKIYPVILGYCRKAFRGHHDEEELTAEAVTVAFLGWKSLQRRGKTANCEPLGCGRTASRHLPDRSQTATSPTSRRQAAHHNAGERGTGERRGAGVASASTCRIADRRLRRDARAKEVTSVANVTWASGRGRGHHLPDCG